MPSYLRDVSGVGPKTEEYLVSNGISSVEQLVTHGRQILAAAPGMNAGRVSAIMECAEKLLQQDSAEYSTPSPPVYQSQVTANAWPETARVVFEDDGGRMVMESEAPDLASRLLEYYAQNGGNNDSLIRACAECADENGQIRIEVVKNWIHSTVDSQQTSAPVDTPKSNTGHKDEPEFKGSFLWSGFIGIVLVSILAASSAVDYLPWISLLYAIGFAIGSGIVISVLFKDGTAAFENLGAFFVFIAPVTFLIVFTGYQFFGLGEDWHDKPYSFMAAYLPLPAKSDTSPQQASEIRPQQRSEIRTLKYSNGTYVGTVVDGKESGKGTYTWTDGNKYEGEWKNGDRTGRGTYTWVDGARYVGDFLNNKKHGKGVKTWPDGDRYEGDWKNGDRTGHGTYTWADGSSYVGDFLNNEKHGKGVKTWASGNKYEGDWKNGDRTGTGTFTWKNGSQYVGSFLNNKKHGKGSMKWSDGSWYKGEFMFDEVVNKDAIVREDPLDRLDVRVKPTWRVEKTIEHYDVTGYSGMSEKWACNEVVRYINIWVKRKARENWRASNLGIYKKESKLTGNNKYKCVYNVTFNYHR